MRAALASKDCDFEASVEELVEDGWAEVASGLRENLLSVIWKGVAEGIETVSWAELLKVVLPQPKRLW